MTEYNENIPEETEDRAQYFCRFTFGQFFTILVLAVITFGFVFYLGARYGNDYLRISDRGLNNSPEITRVISEGIPSKTTSIQDPELQALAREVVEGGSDVDLKMRVREMLNRKSEPETVSASNAVETAEPEVMPLDSEPPSQSSAIDATESSVIRVKTSANAKYSIQVGSYPNMEEANFKIENWRSKGYPAFIMIADIPDRGRWYRVRVGGFASRDDAESYLDRLRSKEGDIEAIIVLNEH